MEPKNTRHLKDVAIPLSADTTGRRTPVREFLLFPWGRIETTQGPLHFDEAAAAELMARYASYTCNRDGWLDIDIAHLSRTDVPDLEAHVSAGKFKTETRADGQWATDLTYLPDIYEAIANEKIKYYSPVVCFDADLRITELQQLGLTNIPSMHIVQPLALSVTAAQKWQIHEGPWDSEAADERVRAFCGSKDGSLDGVSLPRYQKFYAYIDDPEAPSTWKALIGDIVDGKPVISKGAVIALAGALQGARGGIDVPDEDRQRLKALVERYYKKWGAEAPWVSKNSAGGKKTMKFSRIPLLALALSARVEANQALLEDKPGMMSLFRAIADKLGERMPGAHIEDVYEDHVIVGKYAGEAGIVGEMYYKVPYSMAGERVEMGEPMRVKKQWIPADSATMEGEAAMSAKLSQIETLLLQATGAKTTAGAFSAIDALKSGATDAQALSKRLALLETQTFESKRQALLLDAKAKGTWTAHLEAQADKTAAMAAKLGEDRIAAFSDVFANAPVVIAPGQVIPPRVESAQADGLTPEERAICADQARKLGIPEDKFTKAFAENKLRIRV